MQISAEQTAELRIEAYTEHSVTVAGQCYTQSLVIRDQQVTLAPFADWTAAQGQQINDLLQAQPELLLIGGVAPSVGLPLAWGEALSQQQQAYELMHLPAACRTYNILRSDRRDVLAILLLPNKR